MISCTQAVSFYLGHNTVRERFWMSHPRHVLWLASRHYPAILISERGSSSFSGSEDCSGLNMAWVPNKAVFLAPFAQFGSSTVMVMVSSLNTYIEAFFASMSTASWYAWTSAYFPEWDSYSSSSRLWSDWSSVASFYPPDDIVAQFNCCFVHCSVIFWCRCHYEW